MSYVSHEMGRRALEEGELVLVKELLFTSPDWIISTPPKGTNKLNGNKLFILRKQNFMKLS